MGWEKIIDEIIKEDELSSGRPPTKPHAYSGSTVHRFTADADDPGSFLDLNSLTGKEEGPKGFWS